MKPKNETKIEALYYYIGDNLPKKKGFLAMAYRKNSTIIEYKLSGVGMVVCCRFI